MANQWTSQRSVQGIGSTAVSGDVSVGWLDQVRLQYRCAVSMSMTVYSDKIFLSWTDDHGNILWATFDGTKWSEAHQATDGTNNFHVAAWTSPGLGVLGSNLILVWMNADGNGFRWSIFDPSNNKWSAPTRYDAGTDGRIVLSSFDGKLYMAWRGVSDNDTHIFLASYGAGGWTSSQMAQSGGQPFGIMKGTSPALGTCDNQLYLVWMGVRNDGFFWSKPQGENWEKPEQQARFGTYTGISMVEHDDPYKPGARTAFLAWKGTGDDHIWYSTLEGGTWKAQTPIYLVGTKAIPAIVSYHGKLVMTWPGVAGNENWVFSNEFQVAPNAKTMPYEQFANVASDVLNTRFFKGDDWNDMERWERSSALSTMVNYVKRTNSTDVSKWRDVVSGVARNESLYDGNVNDGVDDALWAIISSLDAYELLKEDTLLTRTFTDFNRVAAIWDDVCGGGVYWKFNKSYKNAVTNELFLHAATKLYRLTKKQDYLDWAKKEYEWFKEKFLVDQLINDGIQSPPACAPTGDVWSYNQGIILGGLADLYDITKDEQYLTCAKSIVKVAMGKMVNPPNSVLIEIPTTDLDSDQKVFKGIFMRYLSYLLEVMPRDDPDRTVFAHFVANNADYVWNNQRDSSSTIPSLWDQPSSVRDAKTQASGIDLFTAAIVAAGILS